MSTGKNEISNKFEKFENNVPKNPDEHLQLIIENNIRHYVKILSKNECGS